MPKVSQETPQALRPYIFHGVDLHWKAGGKEALAHCPFCGEGSKPHFSVNTEDGRWQCFKCKAGTERGGGNATTFIRLLWTESGKATNGASTKFAAERGLLYPETLNHWGVCQSVLTKEWLVPGYNHKGELSQLYKRIKINDPKKPGRYELRPTPTLPHAMHGLPLYAKAKGTVYLHESWGNALAFWEIARQAKQTEDGLALTGAESSSILADANVLAVANCGAVGEGLMRYMPLFAGKKVVLMFDSDYPTKHNDRTVEGAGILAVKRLVGLFARAAEPPSEVAYLNWGEGGFDPKRKSGWDVRDALSVGST